MHDETRATDAQAATDALMSASRLITAVVARTLAAVDPAVSVPQLRVLVMLADEAPLNLTAIATGLGVNPSNASRSCDKLVVAGLVEREEDPADRRHLALRLTAKGRRLVTSLMDDRRALLDDVVARLPPVEQRRLARSLTALVAAAGESGLTSGRDGSSSIIPWVR